VRQSNWSKSPVKSNYILMFVVRELGCKLQQCDRFLELRAIVISGRCLGMTDGTDYWSCSFEELRAMTGDASAMARKISNVGKG
jgi:hypothetical protein